MAARDFSKYQLPNDSDPDLNSGDDEEPSPGPGLNLGTNSKVFQSRNLMSATYNPQLGVLTITFVSGGVYEYYSVPQSIWFTLRSAVDPDAYMRAYIRPTFPYRQIA